MAHWLSTELLKIKSLICAMGSEIVPMWVMNIRIDAIAGGSLLIEYPSPSNCVFSGMS